MSDLIQTGIMGLVFLIISIIFAIFSPFGIGFIIFSIIRAKTKSSNLKTVSLVFQIILSILTLLIGTIIGILFSIRNLGFYMYNSSIIITLAVIIGICFVFAIQLGVIIWQSKKQKHGLKTSFILKK